MYVKKDALQKKKKKKERKKERRFFFACVCAYMEKIPGLT